MSDKEYITKFEEEKVCPKCNELRTTFIDVGGDVRGFFGYELVCGYCIGKEADRQNVEAKEAKRRGGKNRTIRDWMSP